MIMKKQRKNNLLILSSFVVITFSSMMSLIVSCSNNKKNESSGDEIDVPTLINPDSWTPSTPPPPCNDPNAENKELSSSENESINIDYTKIYNDINSNFSFKIKEEDNTAIIWSTYKEYNVKQNIINEIQIPKYVTLLIDGKKFDVLVTEFGNGSNHIEYPQNVKYVFRFSEGLVNINKVAFADARMSDYIILPTTLKSIGERAFGGSDFGNYWCEIREVIYVRSNLDNAEYAFNGCRSLKKVIFEDNVTKIPNRIFYGSNAIQEVVFSKNLEIIGAAAFFACNLDNKTINNLPKSLQTIEKSAFASNQNISGSVHFYENIKTISDYSFNNTNITEAYVPSDCYVSSLSPFPNGSKVIKY